MVQMIRADQVMVGDVLYVIGAVLTINEILFRDGKLHLCTGDVSLTRYPDSPVLKAGPTVTLNLDQVERILHFLAEYESAETETDRRGAMAALACIVEITLAPADRKR